MLWRFANPLATCLILVGVSCVVHTFGPRSPDSVRAQCQLRIGNSDQPVPIYFGGTAHDGAPHKLVPAGTACHLEHVPIRAYEVRDVWFLVTIDGGEQSGLQVWARSPYLHPVL